MQLLKYWNAFVEINLTRVRFVVQDFCTLIIETINVYVGLYVSKTWQWIEKLLSINVQISLQLVVIKYCENKIFNALLNQISR